MRIAECLKSVTKFYQNLWLSADDDSKEVLGEEALRRECQTVLLSKQLFAKVDIINYVFKSFGLDSNHHVHRRTSFDWSNTLNSAKSFKSRISC